MNEQLLFEPLSKGNLSDVIVDRITQQLIKGELQPGDQLPTELEFCQELNVSRNVVREAIKVLVTLGIAEIRRAEGTFIVKEYTQNLLNPILYGLILSNRNMAELLEVNICMLCEIMQLVKSRITPEDRHELNRLYQELKECTLSPANDIDRMAELSTEFYKHLCKSARNQLMFQVYNVLLRVFSDARRKAFEIAVATNRREKHLRNYDLTMEYLDGHTGISAQSVCRQIHDAWNDILL